MGSCKREQVFACLEEVIVKRRCNNTKTKANPNSLFIFLHQTIEFMIQRIQTLYLAIAAILAFTLPFFLVRYQSEGGVYQISDNFWLLSAFLLLGLLSVFTIFKYNNRRTQLVLGRLNVIVNFGLFVWMFVDFFSFRGKVAELHAGAGIYLPLLIIVFVSLANRGILHDEKLVREADRLR
jgi:hypothetical protein